MYLWKWINSLMENFFNSWIFYSSVFLHLKPTEYFVVPGSIFPQIWKVGPSFLLDSVWKSSESWLRSVSPTSRSKALPADWSGAPVSLESGVLFRLKPRQSRFMGILIKHQEGMALPQRWEGYLNGSGGDEFLVNVKWGICMTGSFLLFFFQSFYFGLVF